MLTPFRLALLVGVLAFAPAASAQVRLTMTDGQVSISAKNATVAQILAEWARVGQTRIVNADRVPGAPLTLELADVSEAQALDILLRSAGGYLLAPRTTASATGSKFDRILIVAASTAPRAATPQPLPPPTTPTFQAPRVPPRGAPDDDPIPPGGRPSFVGNPPGDTSVAAPAPVATPISRVPTAPFGVARPGMMVPAPPTQTPPLTSPNTP